MLLLHVSLHGVRYAGADETPFRWAMELPSLPITVHNDLPQSGNRTEYVPDAHT